MPRSLKITAAALLAAGALAAPASGATPESGSVTVDSPFTKWSGEATGSALQYGHFFYGAQIVDDCSPPVCDVFALTVGPGGSRLKVSIEDTGGYSEVQIRDASGDEVFFSTGEEDQPTVWTKANPKPGVYTVEVLTDALGPAPVDDPSYEGKADLTVPEPVADPPAPTAGDPAPAVKKKKSCKKKKTKKARKRCKKKRRR